MRGMGRGGQLTARVVFARAEIITRGKWRFEELVIGGCD